MTDDYETIELPSHVAAQVIGILVGQVRVLEETQGSWVDAQEQIGKLVQQVGEQRSEINAHERTIAGRNTEITNLKKELQTVSTDRDNLIGRLQEYDNFNWRDLRQALYRVHGDLNWAGQLDRRGVVNETIVWLLKLQDTLGAVQKNVVESDNAGVVNLREQLDKLGRNNVMAYTPTELLDGAAAAIATLRGEIRSMKQQGTVSVTGDAEAKLWETMQQVEPDIGKMSRESAIAIVTRYANLGIRCERDNGENRHA